VQIVTVPGGNGVTIAIPFTSGDNVQAADLLLANLYYTSPEFVHTSYASAGPATASPYDVNEFIDDEAGQIGLPSGYQYVIDDYKITPNAQYPVNSFIAGGTLDGAVIDATASSLSYQAGLGPETIIAGGNFTLTTRVSGGAAGINTALLDGGGTENLTLTIGTWSVQTGTGAGTVVLGSGNDTITANGAETITGGTGPATVTFDNAHDAFVGGHGTATVVDNGIADSITAGSGRETVFSQSTGLRVQGAGAEVLYVETPTGRGNTVTAGSGGAVVFAGQFGSSYQTGGTYFFYTSGGGNDTITAPAGDIAPIVFGSANGDVHIDGAAAGTFVVAGAGDETIDASDESNGAVFFSGTGSADLLGGKGYNFFAASSGNSTMSGGADNLYQFINGHEGGRNLITDFTRYDSLYLTNFGLGANDGIRSEVVVNGELNMMLGDGTLIIFQNINNPAELNGHIYHI
jgi:hypothetical protein